MISEMLLPSLGFTPLLMIACAVAMVVLRAGASRIFFDVVGTFQATKLIGDAKASATVLESLYIDSLMGIQESAQELADMFNALTDAVMPAAVEIESARVELEKFLDAGDNIDQISDDLEDIGLKFGFAADEAFAAGARMAQLSGVLGGGATPIGTELGVMFGLISGMSTEAAMQRMINLNQQTKFMTENLTENMTQQERTNQIRKDSIRVLDQLNTVENRSAATMQQITFVMNQFASQAHLTGESIAAMAAMSATLIEAGEEQGKGGRALRMIYARLGADTNGARTAIENLGIAVYDAEGNMRPFSELLQQLAVQYEGMNNRQQMALVQTVAGNRHYTRLIKLLENVDRVRELELEAMIAQFPARDELNRRLESEVFQYEQAEARLKNYSAAFGEQLLPAMTQATNVQAQFFKQLNAFAEGPFGSVLTNFIFLSKTMSNFIGPTFQAILGIKGLTIALETQQIVQRALNGEQIASLNLQKQSALQQGIMVQYKTHQKTIIEQTNNVKSVEAEKLREEIRLRALLLQSLDLSQQKRGGLTTAINRYMERLRALGVEIDMVDAQELQHAQNMNITQNQYLINSMTVTKYSMGLGALGSVFMMLGDNEEAMRYGMILTTSAMAMQMVQSIKSMNALVAQSGATQLLGNSSLKAAIQVGHLTKAITLLGKKLLIGLAVFAAVDFLSRYVFKDTAYNIEETNLALADTSMVMEYLNLETAQVNDLLAEKTKQLNAVSDAQGALAQETKSALEMEVASLQKVLDMRTVADLEKSTEAAKEYFNIQQQTNELLESRSGKMGTLEKGTQKALEGIFDLVGKDLQKELTEEDKQYKGGVFGFMQQLGMLEKEMEEWAEENAALFAWLESQNFETMEDMLDGLEAYHETIMKQNDDFGYNISNGIAAATDEIHNFNNAREELFFGFSSDRLTGDLVRQVRQQGVETLITSTEVIMTNNFNGMTTAEVASEILRLIETEGNFKGYNWATTAG
jgi:TP901 family phage tail tape measure protein